MLIICSDKGTNNYQTRSLVGYWCYPGLEAIKLLCEKWRQTKEGRQQFSCGLAIKAYIHRVSITATNYSMDIKNKKIKNKKKQWQIQDKLISEC